MKVQIVNIQSGDTVTLRNGTKHVIGITDEVFNPQSNSAWVDGHNDLTGRAWRVDGTSVFGSEYDIVEAERPTQIKVDKWADIQVGDIAILNNGASRIITGLFPDDKFPLKTYAMVWTREGEHSHAPTSGGRMNIKSVFRSVEVVAEKTITFAFPALPQADQGIGAHVDTYDEILKRMEEFVQTVQDRANEQIEALAAQAEKNLTPSQYKALMNHMAVESMKLLKRLS